MLLTKEAIQNNKENIEGLIDYLTVVSEIEDNISKKPDITIESCKSLIEGLCKKALILISDKYNSDKQLRGTCENQMSTLIKTTFNEIYANSIERDLNNSLYEIIKNKVCIQKIVKKAQVKFLENGKTAVSKITAIRDNKGDISHGRIYPKKESEIHLAKSIVSITDGICSFMILEFSRQYQEKLALNGKLIYSEQEEFNDWLDIQNDKLATKIDFSRMLYENRPEKYEEIYYSEYSEESELESILEEDSNETEKSKVIVEVSNPTIKSLPENFKKDSFWSKEKIEKANAFAIENELIFDEKFKKIIEDIKIYNDEDKIIRSDIANIMEDKPKFKQYNTVLPPLINKIIDFSQNLDE